MSATSEELVRRVVSWVGGAPEILCEQALRGAFADVCGQTRIWAVRRSLTLPDGWERRAGASIELPNAPEETRRDEIRDIRLNGGTLPVPGMAGNVHVGAILDRFAAAKAGDTVEWTEVYVPVSGGVANIPEKVLSSGAEAAVALAASRMLRMPRRPWSDPAAADAAAREHAIAVVTLIRRDLTGGRGGMQMALEGAIDE